MFWDRNTSKHIQNTNKGYYKDLKNLLTYEERRSSTDAEVSDEKLSDIVTPADGYAYGIELFGQKMAGN